MFARAELPEAAVECTVCRRSHSDAAILWALRHGREQVRHLPLGAPAHYERVAQIIALLPALGCWGTAYDEARRLAHLAVVACVGLHREARARGKLAPGEPATLAAALDHAEQQLTGLARLLR